jgi:hypothetical protein
VQKFNRIPAIEPCAKVSQKQFSCHIAKRMSYDNFLFIISHGFCFLLP